MVGVVVVKNVDFPYENHTLHGRKVHPLIHNAIGKSCFSPMRNAVFSYENAAISQHPVARAMQSHRDPRASHRRFSL
jgi:hypothetical protein